jgi:hypothetical protein
MINNNWTNIEKILSVRIEEDRINKEMRRLIDDLESHQNNTALII